MYPVLFSIGWLISKLPEFVVYGLSRVFGELFFRLPTKRLHIIYSNLHHAFPERSPEWLRRTVRQICHRTAEMGLFTLAVPHFSLKRFCSILEVTDSIEKLARDVREQNRPVLILGMHFSMIEAFNAWPAISQTKFPETVIMYRPHKNPRIDALIKNHRERAGFKLVSRKEGIKAIGEAMRAKGIAALLFDQNTRDQGSLIPFFGRVTAATDLPGILAKKYQPILFMTVCRRIAFWRARIEVEELKCELEPAAVTLASNLWLENKLKSSDDYLIDWLWSHNRWKILFRPFERLGMDHRKKITDFADYPLRKTRIALLHQEIEQHSEAAANFLKALRQSRPDAEITLISRNAERFQKQHSDSVDVAHNLFEENRSNRLLAKAMRDHYLDTLLVLDEDPRSLQFAGDSKVPQRLGVNLSGKKCKRLSEAWTPENPNEWRSHPDWIAFGEHFGLSPVQSDAN